ncbi:hypothetical protein SAMN02745181_0434 [Rubritalea squalenifaciens DSM 18772]|uniref:Uncharacterized protein n=1 Tax=Rubritalea squalenifaciens DSM 18772 TaxID=1123071 RepID=A0A1M6CBN2_9BACT|nr:hypothetical protein [Rubritalea squalenifaciens]SHI58128.1 hypothetical protein SAMN02745181_0434 [Rubritalea squalenifaciens DSM 18772]
MSHFTARFTISATDLFARKYGGTVRFCDDEEWRIEADWWNGKYRLTHDTLPEIQDQSSFFSRTTDFKQQGVLLCSTYERMGATNCLRTDGVNTYYKFTKKDGDSWYYQSEELAVYIPARDHEASMEVIYHQPADKWKYALLALMSYLNIQHMDE